MKKQKGNITIEKILKMESDYIHYHKICNTYITESHPNYWTYEYLFTGRTMHVQNRNLTKKQKMHFSQWHLTKFEMLMLLCYLSDLSEIFDDGNPDRSPAPVNKMCKALDRVLIKAPVCSDVRTVYRQCRRRDNVEDWKERQKVTFHHYLTTSIKNWNHPNNQLIITLKERNTNAKALYKMRNKNEEFQVTFKRGATFLIENIEPFEMDGCCYKRIWMKEL